MPMSHQAYEPLSLPFRGSDGHAQVFTEGENVYSALIAFLDRKLTKHCRRIEEDAGFRSDFYREIGTYGIMGMSAPKPFGSSFLWQQMATVFELVANRSVGLAISLAAHTICVYMIGRWGSEAQQKLWLPALCRGEKLGAFCLTEPQAGSDAKSLAMKADQSSEGYLLQGTKTFVTNGGEASVYIVLARINRLDKGNPGGITTFIVPDGILGLVVKPYRKRKVGFGSFPLAALCFSGCLVAGENRLGAEGEGLRLALQTLDAGKINLGAIAVGLAGSAYRSAVAHARRRKQFGRQIADFQAVQFMLVDMHTKITAARMLVRDAAEQLDSGRTNGYETAMAKCYATDIAIQVVTDAAQILGGAGLMVYPLEKNIWEAKLLQILEGTNQIQRLIIARHLLGEDR